MTPLWDTYRLTMTIDRLTGGIPANPKLMQAWLEANPLRQIPTGIATALAASDIPATQEAAIADQTEAVAKLDPEETHAVVFYRDADGKPSYEGRNLKAALKEAANILKDVLAVKNMRSKLAERVFVVEKTVPLNAEVFISERPIQVMTARGERTSIKRFEYAENVTLTFTLKLLKDTGPNAISAANIETLLAYLEDGGVGADRSQGSGTFRLVSFEHIGG